MFKTCLVAGVALVALGMPAFSQSYFGVANTPGANEYNPYEADVGGGYGYRYAPRHRRAALDAYAYAGPVAAGPGSCWVSTHSSRGYGYWGSCGTSNVDTDAGMLGQARPNPMLAAPR